MRRCRNEREVTTGDFLARRRHIVAKMLAATLQVQLVEADKPKHVRGLSDEQVALMERESVSLEREFRIVEKSYGTDPTKPATVPE
jgi:hypothetical protein